MGQNEMRPNPGLPCGVRLTDGLGVAVGGTNDCMPDSSRSPLGKATEALRAAVSVLSRAGCGPID